MPRRQNAPFIALLEERIKSPGTDPAATFRRWLAQQIRDDGRPASSLAQQSGLDRKTFAWLLDVDPPHHPQEKTVRELAAFFGADGDQIAALAGYGRTSPPAPDPLDFPSLADWLAAALDTRGELMTAASRAAGFGSAMFRRIIRGVTVAPDRETLDGIAAYFDVDPVRLRALRVKNPRRVDFGRRHAAQLGPEVMVALAAGRARYRSETQDHSQFGRVGGYTTFHRHGVKQYQEMGQRSAEAQKQRPPPTPEQAEKLRQKRRVAGEQSWRTKVALYGEGYLRDISRRGGQANLDRHGHAELVRRARTGAAKAGDKLRNGQTFICRVCRNKDRPIYRNQSTIKRDRARGIRGAVHPECLINERRDPEIRRLWRDYGEVDWAWRRVKASDDSVLKSLTAKERRAWLAFMKNPGRRGRPATLLTTIRRAKKIATRHYIDGLTSLDISREMNIPTTRNDVQCEVASREFYYQLRLGRVLIGASRRKAGHPTKSAKSN